MSTMYYSSESSDSDGGVDKKSLDLSYLALDLDSLANHLRNSVQEQQASALEPIPSTSGPSPEALSALEEQYKLQRQMESMSSEAMGQDFTNKPSTSGAKPNNNEKEVVQRTSSRTNSVSQNDVCSDDDDKLVLDGITEKLYLNHNHILAIPFEIVLFHKLKVLDLSNNAILQVNDFVLHLPELQTLHLKNNNLEDGSLPKDLSALSKLREINLSGNQLTVMPPQLYEVASLRYLYLANNNITEVSPEITALQK